MMMGIPTLKEYLGEHLDEILNLLGVGKPDVEALIAGLSNTSPHEELAGTVNQLVHFSGSECEIHLDQIKERTGQSKTALRAMLKEAKSAISAEKSTSKDSGVALAEAMLKKHYLGGAHLIRVNSVYWAYNGMDWRKEPNDLIKQHLLEEAPRHIKPGQTIAGVIGQAKNLMEGRVYSDIDIYYLSSEPPLVINCQNGEGWFDKQGNFTFKPHRAESYLRHCAKVPYDPKADSPRFNEALLEILEDRDMVRHFMEVFAFICLPWRDIPSIFILLGSGRNGKTSLVSVIERFIGHDAVMACRIEEIEQDKFRVGALADKLMLVDDDVDAGTCLPDGVLKKISERKVMTGENKYQPSFQFICRALPVLLANDYPAVKDLSFGFERRLKVIPFNRRFAEHEVKLGLFDEIWEEERSGILNRVIEAFQRLKQRGEFDEPEGCLIARKEWGRRSNLLRAFIDEICVKGEVEKQKLKEFYTVYRVYAGESGVVNLTTRQGIEKRLESLGYAIRLLDGEKTVRGLRAPSGWR